MLLGSFGLQKNETEPEYKRQNKKTSDIELILQADDFRSKYVRA